MGSSGSATPSCRATGNPLPLTRIISGYLLSDVTALGGTALAPEALQLLARRGVEAITLCLDRDEPGRRATEHVVAATSQVEESPHVLVVDPHRLAPAKDPDELVRTSGVDALRGALATRECGFVWRAFELVGDLDAEASLERRKKALGRAGDWLGTLQPRLALEQEDAVAAVAERCGYSVEAIHRRFRACYWKDTGVEHESADATKVPFAKDTLPGGWT